MKGNRGILPIPAPPYFLFLATQHAGKSHPSAFSNFQKLQKKPEFFRA